MSSVPSQGFLAALEADYRQISQDARKAEGFVGLFSSSDHPEIKEAAERAVLRIRGFGEGPTAVDQIRGSKVRHSGSGGGAGLMRLCGYIEVSIIE